MPSELALYIADFYDSLSPAIELIKAQTFQDDVFGDGECGYFLLEDIWFLLIYMIMLDKYIKEVREASPCGVLTNKQEIITAWKLDCIRKTFKCKGLNVGKTIKLDILPAYKAFDVGSATGDRGIDFMYIEGAEQGECAGSKETFFVS